MNLKFYCIYVAVPNQCYANGGAFFFGKNFVCSNKLCIQVVAVGQVSENALTIDFVLNTAPWVNKGNPVVVIFIYCCFKFAFFNDSEIEVKTGSRLVGAL